MLETNPLFAKNKLKELFDYTLVVDMSMLSVDSFNAESKRNKTGTKPPDAERHVRWRGRKENESWSENLPRFPTYPI